MLDLASEKLGGKATGCSDDFFAGVENLVQAGPAIWNAHRYTPRGKWMDGWESRRRRQPIAAGEFKGQMMDWAVVRLGAPGAIESVDIDTAYFLGNAPQLVALDARCADWPKTRWVEVLAPIAVKPGSSNPVAVNWDASIFGSSGATEVRLRIYPDGGVARLRVFGRAAVAPALLLPGARGDFAAAQNGAQVLAVSYMFFGAKENLILPGRAANMGEGWETRRRRGVGPAMGNDWSIVRLAAPALIERVLIDTAHFKGNYPDRFSLEAAHLSREEQSLDRLLGYAGGTPTPWRELISTRPLKADTSHIFTAKDFSPLWKKKPVTNLRLHVFPDGGVSRLRVFGVRSSEAEPVKRRSK